MFVCSLCHFEVELDDAELRLTNGHCVCLRCFVRETGTAHEMPKELRKELIATLAAVA